MYLLHTAGIQQSLIHYTYTIYSYRSPLYQCYTVTQVYGKVGIIIGCFIIVAYIYSNEFELFPVKISYNFMR